MTDSPKDKAMLRIRVLSEHLIESETGRNNASGSSFPAADICAKLRPQLATLMGTTGFGALLARALTLAAADAPALRTIRVDPDGLLKSADGPPAPISPAANTEASVLLIVQLLTLLVAFIGEQLALQILRDIWPHLQRNTSNSVRGDSE